MNKQLIFVAALVPLAALTACTRADTDENARRAATAHVAESTASTGADGAVATTGTAPYTPPGDIGRTDDASVTAFVQSQYFMDDDLKGRHIQVDTSNRVVTLHGDVASDNERAKALLLARTTPGVERVEDALTVNASLPPATGPGSVAQPAAATPAQSADVGLADQVKSRLAGDLLLKPGSIEVTVKDGVALLDGTAPNAAAKQRALKTVRETDGVVQVIDKITVRRLR